MILKLYKYFLMKYFLMCIFISPFHNQRLCVVLKNVIKNFKRHFTHYKNKHIKVITDFRKFSTMFNFHHISFVYICCNSHFKLSSAYFKSVETKNFERKLTNNTSHALKQRFEVQFRFISLQKAPYLKLWIIR
jgi:hypothetical protein